LATAAAGQLAVGRAILAEQLNAISDPIIQQQIAARTTGQSAVGLLGRGSAVGYQPVIITLPEGTNFAVTGVISADRRYVRITALPIFSGRSEERRVGKECRYWVVP